MIRYMILFFGGISLMSSVGANAAGEAEMVAPAGLVEAFNQSCGGGFPDFARVRASALAQGWTANPGRVIQAPRGAPAFVPPETFRKGPLLLFLMSANPQMGMRHSCQVTVTDTLSPARRPESAFEFELDALTGALALPAPEITRSRDGDSAAWRLANGNRLVASVDRRRRNRSRSATLIVQVP
jgi:hypothetical protein